MKFELIIKTTTPNGKDYSAGLVFDERQLTEGRGVLDARLSGLVDYVQRFVSERKWEDEHEVPNATKPA